LEKGNRSDLQAAVGNRILMTFIKKIIEKGKMGAIEKFKEIYENQHEYANV
jgi:hypothetical protein